MSTRESVECWILTNNSENTQVLLLRRISKDRYWQPVTGGIEYKESPKQAARREVKEETGIDVKEGLFHVIKSRSRLYIEKNDETIIKTTLYAVVEKKDPVISEEHCDYIWVHPSEALKLLKWENNKDNLRLALKRLQKKN